MSGFKYIYYMYLLLFNAKKNCKLRVTSEGKQFLSIRQVVPGIEVENQSPAGRNRNVCEFKLLQETELNL